MFDCMNVPSTEEKSGPLSDPSILCPLLLSLSVHLVIRLSCYEISLSLICVSALAPPHLTPLSAENKPKCPRPAVRHTVLPAKHTHIPQ